ncbi:glycoside hydrolase family 27 protein [Abortiporus biennis]|nr:glycoside hydrolase family 27 protein [Abortiporus biennis]
MATQQNYNRAAWEKGSFDAQHTSHDSDHHFIAIKSCKFYYMIISLTIGLLGGLSIAHLNAPKLSSQVILTSPANLPPQTSAGGHLPIMGYNTWNSFACNINESIILDTVNAIKTHSLDKHGYTFINIDDCYSEKQRNKDGDIVESKERFPSGMRTLTDKIHDLGFFAGIYSSAGWFTCQLYPASFQNEKRDAKLFRDTWNFDYLKYDNCAVPYDSIIKEGIVGKYKRMSDAIQSLAQETGREPLILSLCEWGWGEPWVWAKEISVSWRTTGDIEPKWKSVTSILNYNSFIAYAVDFGAHNDMDILEVGNGNLTYDEAKSHFTAWALMKSPLLISTDFNSITPETISILTNDEIIAINQDPLYGGSVTPFRWGINSDWTFNSTHPAQYWSGRSQNGVVFMLLNTLEEPANMSFNLTESPWIRAGRQYAVRDLWSKTSNGTAVRNFTAHDVPPHGVVALLLQDDGDEPEGIDPPCSRMEWCTDKNGTVLPSQ